MKEGIRYHEFMAKHCEKIRTMFHHFENAKRKIVRKSPQPTCNPFSERNANTYHHSFLVSPSLWKMFRDKDNIKPLA